MAKQGFFRRIFSTLSRGVAKARHSLRNGLRALVGRSPILNDQVLDDIEEQLLLADFGVKATARIVEDIRAANRDGRISRTEEVFDWLKAELTGYWPAADREMHMADSGPTVIMVAGVNGTGKTTSIAKLAKSFKDGGLTVLLAAADTFRAAAVEQLTIWSQRLGVEIVKHQTGSDPGAVAYDACEAAKARGADVLIVDTAGRLHTQDNLMRELGKIRRVIERQIAGAPHEVLLVLDATTGQNAINQAREFRSAIDVTGIILAKMDGTAKGGIVVAIRDCIDIPVKFIGVGEQLGDLQPFDPESFVEALLGKDGEQ
jgi:fused signal recognition particle receptor